jgi:ubiquinone/menaquinone biosynthesis C-methylase UbiE
MNEAGYVLGQSERAAQRLALQDRHIAAASEALLDALELKPNDRVVELGCGPGAFTRRILKRLGPGGVVLGVDASAGLLQEARKSLAGAGPGRFELLQADVSEPGPWLDGVQVLVGRAVLHHIPMVEYLLGQLRTVLPPGTRLGFLEPDFRRALTNLAYVAVGRPELAPLLIFERALNDLYAAWRISPAVGASLAPTLEDAGYANVRHAWHPFVTDADVIENMIQIYDEVRDTFAALNISSPTEMDEQKKLLAALPIGTLPTVWGVHQVTAVV